MAKRNKSILPGLVDKGKKPSSLDSIKNAAGNRGSSALPIMKYFGDVKPSRNERIIKPDMTLGGKVTKQDLPIIREILKPGFSGNFRTNYTPPSAYDADAVVYFTAVEDAGGELTLLEKDLVNTWFVTERAAGRLSKYKAVYPFKGKVEDAAAINMVNPSTYDLSFTNFVAADFAVSGVLQGDGSTKYASISGVSATDIFTSQYDTFIYAYAQIASTAGSNRVIIGGRDNASTDFLNIYPSTIANGIFAQAPTNLILQTGSGNDLLDRESCSYLRTSDSQAYLYRNSIEEDNNTTTVSGNLPSNDMTVFAWNNNGIHFCLFRWRMECNCFCLRV